MNMSYDVIIYAVIAVLVLAKLWSVLGQRNAEDRERPNPFAAPPPVAPEPTSASPLNRQQAEMPILLKAPQHAPNSLAGGLAQIKETDPAFDEKQFLQTARSSFTQILSEFAKGELVESAKLLGPSVLPSFREAIEERRAAGETMEHKLVAIREAECISAKTENGKAMITVRFITEQESTLRDSAGNIIGGSEGKVEEITDLWTFARDAKPTDQPWILTETRS